MSGWSLLGGAKTLKLRREAPTEASTETVEAPPCENYLFHVVGARGPFVTRENGLVCIRYVKEDGTTMTLSMDDESAAKLLAFMKHHPAMP